MDERNTDTLGQRALRYLWRLTRLLLAIAIYALVLWYGAETAQDLDTPPVVTEVAVALIALGIAGSIYRILIDVAKEAKGAIMVLADFLNTNLVEPQKRRLIERGREEGRTEGREEGRTKGREEGRTEGREEGRTETIARVRSILMEEGVDPDLISRIDAETGDISDI